MSIDFSSVADILIFYFQSGRRPSPSRACDKAGFAACAPPPTVQPVEDGHEEQHARAQDEQPGHAGPGQGDPRQLVCSAAIPVENHQEVSKTSRQVSAP